MEELIPIVAIFFVIGVPVMSIAARLARRPQHKDFSEAMGSGSVTDGGEQQKEMARLQAQVAEQGRQLDQLADAELFRRDLESRREATARLATPPSTTPH
jgi:hypothetical protein